jgi:hypothetical protein
MLPKLFIAAAGLIAGAAALGNAQAQALAGAEWEAGKHYFVIDPAQPTTSGDKIEVTEVFSYGRQDQEGTAGEHGDEFCASLVQSARGLADVPARLSCREGTRHQREKP